MPKNLKALKVIVGINPENGHAAYPNFNLISETVRKNMDWSKYIDAKGGGWHYDKTSGHKDDTADSPEGQQICCLCVPADFHAEALALFGPDGTGQVSDMTEADFEVFHDTKAHADEPDEILNTDLLVGLKAQRQLMKDLEEDTTALDNKIRKALNPEDNEPGVKPNFKKKWADVKKNQGITITDT